jgi:hypothetical protein
MELGVEVDKHDITSYSDRQAEIDLKQYQAMVLGVPVHSRRAPRVVREWLRTLDGKGKKCSMFFTYGGFGVHPAPYSTRQILEEQGFAVVSSAEFLGKHTFNLGGWKALADRPDASDFHVAKEYVTKTHKRVNWRRPTSARNSSMFSKPLDSECLRSSQPEMARTAVCVCSVKNHVLQELWMPKQVRRKRESALHV